MGSGRTKTWFWGLLGLLLQLLVIAGSTGLSAAVPPAAPRKGQARGPGLLIAFRPTAAAASRLDAVRRIGLEFDPTYHGRRAMRLRAPGAGDADLVRLARMLRDHPAVRSVEPDYPLHTQGIPNDVRFSQLWGLHNTGQTGGLADADIDAPEAWDVTTGSPSVIVAVVDTGVDTNHPDLRDNILRDNAGSVIGWDFANDDSDPQDDNGHGTHVAGTIGARGGNTIGVVGVAPNVRIMPVKFLQADGNGSTADAIEAIDFAVAHGARILNCSWGGGAYSQFLLEAVRRARDAGVLVIAAAGNDGRNNDERPEFPAGYNRFTDNLLSVAATDSSDRVAGFSNYGVRNIDLCAPGATIYSTTPNSQYGVMSGTSMATPHVSGAAALIWSRYPGLSFHEVKDRLVYNTDEPLTVDPRVPPRRLNAAAALVEDTAAPGHPFSLSLLASGASGLLFSWTSSGDDDRDGAANRYELYYSQEPITDLAHATLAQDLPTPRTSGSPETFLLAPLLPTADYYVALRAVDNVGNVSALTTLGHLRTPYPGAPAVGFSDDAEGVPQFAGQKPWAVTAESSFSPTHCYTDSPGTLYGVRVDSSLTSVGGMGLVGFVPRLEFMARTDLEAGFDYLFVEVSDDFGETWKRLDVALTGSQDWLPESVSLGRFYGESVRIRFRLVTDEVVTAGGVWLDDIRVTGDPLVPVAATVPAAPSELRAVDARATEVELAWQDNSTDETSFQIERRAGAGSFGIVGTTGAEIATYVDTGLLPNTRYTYRVRASNAAGDSPATADLEVQSLPLAPPPPTSLQATAGDTNVELEWHAAAGAASYRVKRATSRGGPYRTLAEVEDGVEYLDSAVQVGVTYYYVVSSAGGGGESVDGNEASATPGFSRPLPPTALVARVHGKQVRLTWTPSVSVDITATRIYRATTPAGPFVAIASAPVGKKARYVDPRPGRGRYYYRITALDTHDQESVPSGGVDVQVGKKQRPR